jgi:hypothetical protein
MMSCEEFQLHAGADPRGLTWRRLLHVLLCRACARYSREVRAFDLRIEKALNRIGPA